MPSNITIESHMGPYEVKFGNLMQKLKNEVSDLDVILIDKKVASLYAKTLGLPPSRMIEIEAKESNKSLDKIPDLIENILLVGFSRKGRIISIGGGITQDISCFIASTLFRGVEWLFVPTTLLAQADSCIGSKSSINVRKYKNQMGTYYPPGEILLDPDFLGTLKKDEIHSGIGEIIKVHIISGWSDFSKLEKNINQIYEDRELLLHFVHRALIIKQTKIEADEFDRGIRLVMNYGHTIGHAIEGATDYAIPHGIAISLGMDAANFLAMKSGIMKPSDFSRLHQVIRRNYLHYSSAEVPLEPFFENLVRDKKNTDGKVTFILGPLPGDLDRHPLPLDQGIKSILKEFFERKRK